MRFLFRPSPAASGSSSRPDVSIDYRDSYGTRRLGARRLLRTAVSAGVLILGSHDLHAATSRAPSPRDIRWPAGTVVAPFEDLDGAVLLRATRPDPGGVFVLATGAGFTALDEPLAVAMGIAARHSNEQIEFTQAPLPRFRLGDLDIEQAQTLIFDAEVIRNVTDRPVLGLF